MHLSLTEEQRLIVDSATSFLEDASRSSLVRDTSEHGDGFDRSLWTGLADLGWCGILLPEHLGGLGAGWVELVLLQEQLGRRLACVPYFDSVALAGSLMQALPPSPCARARLGGLARGTEILALALPAAQTNVPARVARNGPRLELSGCWPRVGSAQFAHTLLLPAQDDEGALGIWVVPGDTPGLERIPLSVIDGTRRMADVRAHSVNLPPSACLSSGAPLIALLERTRCLAAIALAAEQIGVAQQALDLTLAYTAQRVQFGQPVARFQALKHRCAQMLVALETARSAVYGAACIADTEPDPPTLLFHAAHALGESTDAALLCTRESIQLHGGVGFTWEYDPHLYFRRAQASSHRLGPLSWWREQVARQLLDTLEAPA